MSERSQAVNMIVVLLAVVLRVPKGRCSRSAMWLAFVFSAAGEAHLCTFHRRSPQNLGVKDLELSKFSQSLNRLLTA
jgi:hypothetical protein